MTTSLSRFQDAFAAALYGASPDDPSFAALIAQPGFSVYRNNVVKSGIDALQANFPTVARLVGDDWFRAAASIYVHRSPPSDPRLLLYGDGFANFLATFEPARDLPYLPDVASLDRLWIEVHASRDEAGLDAAALAGLDPARLEQMVLPLRTSVRWRWFAGLPAYTIWRCNREAVNLPEPLDWSGDGVLLTRPDGAVIWQALGPGGCAFLDACAARHTLGQAAQHALDAEPSIDFTRLLVDLVSAGAFAAIDPDSFRH